MIILVDNRIEIELHRKLSREEEIILKFFREICPQITWDALTVLFKKTIYVSSKGLLSKPLFRIKIKNNEVEILKEPNLEEIEEAERERLVERLRRFLEKNNIKVVL